MKKLLLFLFICSTSLLYSQNEQKLSVYFKSDQSSITVQHKKKLNSFIKSLDLNQVKNYEVSGHTDNVGTERYNFELSAKRAESISEYLSTNFNLKGLVGMLKALGENSPIGLNSNEKERQLNRRVELLVYFKKSSIKQDSIIPEDSLVVDEINCEGDTTIRFSQGTEVTLNKCEYLKIKDCFGINEFNTEESLQQSDLTTMTTSGDPLISGGMIELKLCGGICPTIRLPLRNNCTDSLPMNFWSINSNGTWRINSETKVELVRINGRNYYEFKTCASGFSNVDRKEKYSSGKFSIVAKDDLKVLEMKLSYSCPSAMFIGKINKRKNKARFKVGSPKSEPSVFAKVLTKEGDTLVMDFKPLINIEKRKLYGKTGKSENTRSILLIPFKSKPFYRRYILREKDFHFTGRSI